MNLPTLAAARDQLDRLAPWLAPLGLRLLLAWEFFESGREKLRGQNWFADLQDAFPFPFDQLPATLNWQLATWFELLGAACLLFGFGTRFAAASLLVLTVVLPARERSTALSPAHSPLCARSLGCIKR